jgi:hypothetical protein
MNSSRSCQRHAESNKSTNSAIWNASSEGCPSPFSKERNLAELATSQETTKNETCRV